MRCPVIRKAGVFLFAAGAAFLSLYSGCNRENDHRIRQIQYVIGVSQANMRDPWRLVLLNELKQEAALQKNIRLVYTDASNDTDKQKEDIQKLVASDIDLLIVSPCDAVKLTPVISAVYAKMPVIILDKVVEGYQYTLFIGPDNVHIGKKVGEAVAGLAGNRRTSVLELAGNRFSEVTAKRSAGFNEIIKKHPDITVSRAYIDDGMRDSTEDYLYGLGNRLKRFDILFTHNDYMAMGAYRAVRRRGFSSIRIVSVDGFSIYGGGLDLLEEGALAADITCATGGKEAVQYAVDILHHRHGVPKQIILQNTIVTPETVAAYRRKMNMPEKEPLHRIRVGDVQVDETADWRRANRHSIATAARDFGIDLTTIATDTTRKSQQDAIRSFIREKMDVIVLTPVQENGWKPMLEECRQAGIPVILSDRRIAFEDEELYRTYIGGDFMEEGRRAMRWVLQNIYPENRSVSYVTIMEIRGIDDATPTNGRHQGFEEILEENPRYRIVSSVCGEFTYAKSFQLVTEYFSRKDHSHIDVIYTHNDDMGLGAMDALEKLGIVPGKDVKIVSIDGISAALKALRQGKMNCVIECSPLLGPQLMKAVTDLMHGKELPLRIITDEIVFTKDTPKALFKNREY